MAACAQPQLMTHTHEANKKRPGKPTECWKTPKTRVTRSGANKIIKDGHPDADANGDGDRHRDTGIGTDTANGYKEKKRNKEK